MLLSTTAVFRSPHIATPVSCYALLLQLTPEEQFFLDNASADIKRQFEAADKAIGEAAVMSMAAGGRPGGR